MCQLGGTAWVPLTTLQVNQINRVQEHAKPQQSPAGRADHLFTSAREYVRARVAHACARPGARGGQAISDGPAGRREADGGRACRMIKASPLDY
ncbi:hypothetical protein E2562_004851 [Oryza meyeriana var. granulata]|uniref:Uncharacterized protein n=1 Tax=Oryza meyeriana var. granulata TaxID=110450 RepID=A0A6G1DE51_9ORYZ|nr:hypothetical protein E2562_004851 [Oryza meyeriana var. granulata]